MGLDMYLYKRTYVGAQWEHRDVKGTIDITIRGERVPITFGRVQYIIEQVAYWRKANAIHKWFVDNVQGGVDDCREYDVDMESLRELLDVCNHVLASKKTEKNDDTAKSLLPTRSGFFFGSTDYDEWYYHDIQLTIDQLEKILAEPEGTHSYLVYDSSW